MGDMRGSSAFSIMVDESTDVSMLKQLVLYGRAVVGGELVTRFLIIIDTDDKTTPLPLTFSPQSLISAGDLPSVVMGQA